ncbi:MAG: hypothetical protein UU35_C0002G0119 [Candidatus Uhrbacteria bacterium GW2011_GWC2_41_11]|uniref:Uncharacterized protein n=1 Tax=Candidatus Uhrbacteria bacterium GW2011_GWC2_41_11 TaxID=1618985 RepID=A0A0G0UFF5_9BACT|nr:MAG: hypothetical protein UU35_C0002G0119 [Candidatus Uhrbacteria bacterium GW2011_GWC2_41_11]
MARRNWSDVLVERLLEVVEEDSSMDHDDLVQAIRDSIDISEVVSEIYQEDPELRQAVKKKIRDLFLRELEVCDSLEAFTGDDYAISEYLPEDLSVERVVSAALEPDGDAGFRDKVTTRIKDLFSKELENCDSLEAFTGDDYAISEYLPEDFVSNTLTELFTNNQEAKKELLERMRHLLDGEISNIDSDSLPEWKELRELLDIDEAIKKISKEDEIRAKVLDALRETVRVYIEENLDSSDLPDDFTDKLFTIAPIDQLLSDREFRRQITDLLVNALRQLTVDQLEDVDSELNQRLLTSGALLAITRQMEDLVHNPEVQHRIKETLQNQFHSDRHFVELLVQGLMNELSKTMINRLFEKI